MKISLTHTHIHTHILTPLGREAKPYTLPSPCNNNLARRSSCFEGCGETGDLCIALASHESLHHSGSARYIPVCLSVCLSNCDCLYVCVAVFMCLSVYRCGNYNVVNKPSVSGGGLPVVLLAFLLRVAV